MSRQPPRRLRSGMGRPIDFSLGSNRFVVGASVAAGIVAGAWTLLQEGDLAAAFGRGTIAGLASFLAWATARELDPDHTVTAGIAAVAAPWLLLHADPTLAGGFAVMISVRALAGTTGSAPYPADAVFVSSLAVWTATSDGGLATTVFALAVLAGSTLFDPRSRRTTVVIAMLAAGAAVAAAIVADVRLAPVSPDTDLLWMWLALATLVITLGAMRIPVTATADRKQRPLDRRRVQWGIAATGAWVIVMIAWHGASGLPAAGPATVALAATAVSALRARGRRAAPREAVL